MRPIQPPPPLQSSSSSPLPSGTNRTDSNRNRRRPGLTIPLPKRDTSSVLPLPLPLPLPPSTSSSPSTNVSPQPTQLTQLSFSELDKERRIGSGSGGTVYKVKHKPTGKFFALKVIYGNHEDAVRKQICREIEILRQVNNPSVVNCHGMFDNNGEIQVLLEYMDGGSLEGFHISNEKNLAHLSHQILCGLSYLHRRKIVHRDIKPSNLLINARMEVKIADFGVSRILAQTMDPCNSAVGTIAYMSPERINTDLNEGVYDGYAGDIWSFGVSILEFYLGKFPFNVSRQGDWASLMCAICIAPPPEAPPTASREFRSFLSACLQREPSKRWTAERLLLHPFIAQNRVISIQNQKQTPHDHQVHLLQKQLQHHQLLQQQHPHQQNPQQEQQFLPPQYLG